MGTVCGMVPWGFGPKAASAPSHARRSVSIANVELA